MSDSRRFPWLSGLIAALAVAAWLVYDVISDVFAVMHNAVESSLLP